MALATYPSYNTAPELGAPKRLSSHKLAPLNDEVNRLAPPNLTLARFAFSKLALSQLAPCHFEAYQFELLQ